MRAQKRKKKVDPSDAAGAREHRDLGVAYLNKGLIDEAIKEYKLGSKLRRALFFGRH